MYLFIITTITSIIATSYVIYGEQSKFELSSRASLELMIQSYKRGIAGAFITFIVGTLVVYIADMSIQPLLGGVLIALWYEFIASVTISCTVFILLPIKVRLQNDSTAEQKVPFSARSAFGGVAERKG